MGTLKLMHKLQMGSLHTYPDFWFNLNKNNLRINLGLSFKEQLYISLYDKYLLYTLQFFS